MSQPTEFEMVMRAINQGQHISIIAANANYKALAETGDHLLISVLSNINNATIALQGIVDTYNESLSDKGETVSPDQSA